MGDPPEPVLDASAFLAYLQGEPGSKTVRDALAEGCCMSAVNWAEVISKVAELGKPSYELIAELTDRHLLGAALRIVPFDDSDAALVGDLRPQTRHLGLSLGDRACLALGSRRDCAVLTADRDWDKARLGLDIRIIR